MFGLTMNIVFLQNIECLMFANKTTLIWCFIQFDALQLCIIVIVKGVFWDYCQTIFDKKGI